MRMFQEDLRNGMTLDQALKKHHLTFKEAFHTLKGYASYSKKRKPKNPETRYIMRQGKRYLIRKKINKKYVIFGRYATMEEAIIIRDALNEDGWNIDSLDRICQQHNIQKLKPRKRKQIIERNSKEYLDEIQTIYRNEIKPILDQGESLSYAIRSTGRTSGRVYYDLRDCALQDGYKLRR